MALTRTQISLSDEDRKLLDSMRQRTGQSISVLIHDAIHSTYGSAGSADNIRAALDSTFGVVSTDGSGEDLVESIRSGRRLTEA